MKFQLFYDPKEPYGFCSNFFPMNKPLRIRGEDWETTEHYFQAMKFRGKNASKRSLEYSNLIRKADSPMKVKLLGSQKKNLHFGKKWVLNKKTDKRLVNDLVEEYKDLSIREDWEKVKIQVMVTALLEKFKDPILKRKLTNLPPNTLLVEHTNRDSVWADGGDGGTEEIGRNYLGKILTAISYVLRDGSCQKMSEELREKVLIRKKNFPQSLNTGKNAL